MALACTLREIPTMVPVMLRKMALVSDVCI